MWSMFIVIRPDFENRTLSKTESMFFKKQEFWAFVNFRAKILRLVPRPICGMHPGNW